MPVQIRTLDSPLTAAGYRFPSKRHNAAEEDWPWLRLPFKPSNLCENCSRLNFQWLFTEALSGHVVTVGTLSAKLSDGICLGLHKDISSRADCDFCQLVVHALEYGADIEMLNQYNDWPQKEIWINNHFYDAQDNVVMIPVADRVKRVARLGIRFASDAEDNVLFVHGGRHVMIQQISASIHDSIATSGRALSENYVDLIERIRTWIEPCLDQRSAVTVNEDSRGTFLRLIDTQDQCIVGPLSNKRYVALR